MPPADTLRQRCEEALTDLVQYVCRHEVKLRRALLYIEHDFGRDVRQRIGERLLEADRTRHPRTARELVWAAVTSFTVEEERVVDVTAQRAPTA